MDETSPAAVPRAEDYLEQLLADEQLLHASIDRATVGRPSEEAASLKAALRAKWLEKQYVWVRSLQALALGQYVTWLLVDSMSPPEAMDASPVKWTVGGFVTGLFPDTQVVQVGRRSHRGAAMTMVHVPFVRVVMLRKLSSMEAQIHQLFLRQVAQTIPPLAASARRAPPTTASTTPPTRDIAHTRRRIAGSGNGAPAGPPMPTRSWRAGRPGARSPDVADRQTSSPGCG
jgi:hypothetical protein